MSSVELLEFFKMATAVVVVIYFISTGFVIFAPNWMYSVTRKMFQVERPAFDIIIYCYLGFFKVGMILLFLVPLIALCLIS